MLDVVVDDTTNEMVCLAVWEPADMSFMALLNFLIAFIIMTWHEGFAFLIMMGRAFMEFETKRHELGAGVGQFGFQI